MSSSSVHGDDTGDPTGEERATPTGIKLYCVVVTIFTLFSLFQIFTTDIGRTGSLRFFLLFVFIAQLVLLHGLWTLKSWAWIIGMILFSLSLFGAFADGDLLGVIIYAGLVAYLYGKESYYQSG